MSRSLWLLPLLTLTTPLTAAEKTPVSVALTREIIGPRQTLLDLQDYCDARIRRMPRLTTVAAWEKEAGRIRQGVLDRVVFRGAAASWRKEKGKVKWFDAISGGPGYRIRKVRYEALTGLWIPALLYEPDKLSGKMPVCLAVNGHDRRKGKAADYKQMRCINLAKRGVLVFNVEWLGMGQLHTPGFDHGRMNQLDLCGTSGLAPFYLAMSRGLDLLLAQPGADPKRVLVCGLSGGGWQTIVISSLDPRVTLSNPVAGYSSFRTHLRHYKDLGDSEQTPTDLATVADYTHLTALRAPRPTLLTYNAKDDCCFEAGYSLPPLLDAARPVFTLYGKEKSLRSHVNHDPGTHNYGKDNRQALYRVVGDFFFPDNPKYSAEEIPSAMEVKAPATLDVELPAHNEDFHTLALSLAKSLPRVPALPGEAGAARKWQDAQRAKLRSILRANDYRVTATRVGRSTEGGTAATLWKLKLDASPRGGTDAKYAPVNTWTVPVVELVRGRPKGTALLLKPEGRRSAAAEAERLLKEGYRVLAVDLFSFGEAKLPSRGYLFNLMVATVGGRPLGLQASQLAAVARWSQTEYKNGPVTVVALGPRLSTIALAAAGLEVKALGALELDNALPSFKQVIEQNHAVNEMPELFCFGLLEALDVKQLAALAAPRPVVFRAPTERLRTEMAGLKAWYKTLGRDFDPLPINSGR